MRIPIIQKKQGGVMRFLNNAKEPAMAVGVMALGGFLCNLATAGTGNLLTRNAEKKVEQEDATAGPLNSEGKPVDQDQG